MSIFVTQSQIVKSSHISANGDIYGYNVDTEVFVQFKRNEAVEVSSVLISLLSSEPFKVKLARLLSSSTEDMADTLGVSISTAHRLVKKHIK